MSPYLLAALTLLSPLSGGGARTPLGLAAAYRAHRQVCAPAVRKVDLSPYGGMSLKFMLHLQGGAVVVFKPRQTLYSARYEAEIAAYRLAMELGVTLVPPACERTVPRAAILSLVTEPRQARLRERLEKEVPRDSATRVTGAAIHFVRHIRDLGKVAPATWRTWLKTGATVPAAERARAGEAADLVLLDLLFSNPDRFTGGNLLEDRDTGHLLMIDNGADFRAVATLERPYHKLLLGLLGRVRAPTYARLRSLSRARLRRVLARSGRPGAYLTPREQRALLSRRDALVRHVERLRRQHSDAAVLLP